MLYIFAALLVGITIGRSYAYETEFAHVSDLTRKRRGLTKEIPAYWRGFVERQTSENNFAGIASVLALILCGINYYFWGWTIGP